MPRLLTQMGMGASLRNKDYTGAAVRGVKNTLWRNSINLAELYGKQKTDMQITVEIGVADPTALDMDALAAVFPYGQVTVVPRKGGMDVPRADGGNPTVMAAIAISVALDLEEPA